MLAIDTNVVIRYLVRDDPIQATKAQRLIANNDIFVSTTVLLETEWVLRSLYAYEPGQIATALAAFSGLPRVTVQDAFSAATAVAWMLKGIDFADALHLVQSAECDEFVSFDERFVKAANRLSRIPVRKL